MTFEATLKTGGVRPNFLFGLGSHLGCTGILILTMYYLVVQISAQQANELLGWIIPLAQACCFFAAVALAFGLITRESEASGDEKRSLAGWLIRRILPYKNEAPADPLPITAERGPSSIEVDATLALVKSVDWKVFKNLAIGYYQHLGFRVLDQPARSKGLDFLLYLHSDYTVVGARCLPRGTDRVSVDQVQSFHRAILLAGARHGVMLTAGTYDEEAMQFAGEKSLELLGGDTFVRRLLMLPQETMQQLLDVARGAERVY